MTFLERQYMNQLNFDTMDSHLAWLMERLIVLPEEQKVKLRKLVTAREYEEQVDYELDLVDKVYLACIVSQCYMDLTKDEEEKV